VATQEEINSLEKLLDAENSHFKQWLKHLMALITILLSITVTFLRGSKKSPSILKLQKCGPEDQAIFGIFVILMVILSLIGLVINRREQELKQKVGKGLVDSDIRYDAK